MTTRLEILALSPGRDLDTLVAKHVVNLPVMTSIHDDKEYAYGWFRPSTEMMYAFQVLNTASVKDKYQIGVYPTSFGKWVAKPFIAQYTACEVQAATVAEAVCKSALLAVLNL